MEDIYYIYHIFRPEDEGQYDKGYIGITKNFNHRKIAHLSYLKNNKHYNTHLQNAYNKYGNLQFKVIVITTYEHACYLENCFRPIQEMGWNLSIGGEAPMKNYKATKETSKKQSDGLKIAYQNDPSLKERMNHSRRLKIEERRKLGQRLKKSKYKYICNGITYNNINDAAEQLQLSPSTIRERCMHIFTKMELIEGKRKLKRYFYKDYPDKINPYKNWNIEEAD